MQSIYKILICSKCKKSTILLTEEVEDTKNKNKYLACAHCGCKNFIKEKDSNDLRECMKERRYKRVKGALRQVEWCMSNRNWGKVVSSPIPFAKYEKLFGLC